MGSIRKRPSGSYEALYRDPAGRLRSKSFRTKAESKAFLASIETDQRRGEWTDPRHSQIPFSSWAREHLASRLHLRAATRARDKSLLETHLIPHFGEVGIGRLSPLDVQSWVTDLQEAGLSPRTVREAYRVFNGIMAAAVTARLIPDSPCRGIALPRPAHEEQRFLSAEEASRLADAIDPLYRSLILSAVYLGCRWGELVGLKRANLNVLRRELKIVGTLEEVAGKLRYVEETKTGASRRTLSMPSFLAQSLGEHLGFVPDSEFVFAGRDGAPLRRGNFRKRHWLPAVRDAALEPLRFHDLRHTCAALLIANGAHVKEIQTRLGHASITTTMNIYGHLLPNLDERTTSALERTYLDSLTSADERSPETGSLRATLASG